MSNNEATSSKLFYHGTNIEVRLGDRIRVRRLFWRWVEGVVCYLPGISPTHRALEFRGEKQWAYRTPDGTFYAMLYHPETFQPPKKIEFIARSNEPGITPDTELN